MTPDDIARKLEELERQRQALKEVREHVEEDVQQTDELLAQLKHRQKRRLDKVSDPRLKKIIQPDTNDQ